MNTQKELLTKKEAAEILGISYCGIQDVLRRGALRTKTIRKSIRIVRQSVYEYLNEDEAPKQKMRKIYALRPTSERPILN